MSCCSLRHRITTIFAQLVVVFFLIYDTILHTNWPPEVWHVFSSVIAHNTKVIAAWIHQLGVSILPVMLNLTSPPSLSLANSLLLILPLLPCPIIMILFRHRLHQLHPLQMDRQLLPAQAHFLNRVLSVTHLHRTHHLHLVRLLQLSLLHHSPLKCQINLPECRLKLPLNHLCHGLLPQLIR